VVVLRAPAAYKEMLETKLRFKKSDLADEKRPEGGWASAEARANAVKDVKLSLAECKTHITHKYKQQLREVKGSGAGSGLPSFAAGSGSGFKGSVAGARDCVSCGKEGHSANRGKMGF
jgi:hypothetical protein